MNGKYILGLLCFITLSLFSSGQNVNFRQYLGGGDNTGNDTVFKSGLRNILYNFQIDNGYANLVILPIDQYNSYIRGENYTEYNITSGFRFNNIDRESGWVNIDYDFYVIIHNNGSDKIYIYGSVNVLSPAQTVEKKSIGVVDIILIIVAVIILVVCIFIYSRNLYKYYPFCNKDKQGYTPV